MKYDELLEDLFQAYYEARKGKRKTLNQLDFEINLESNLIKLADEIYNKTYKVWKSIAFIIDKPVKREIFAWDFRDRVVHHFLISKLNYIFEKQFIYDSYSCRVWKGTSFGVQRLQKAIRSCSENYQEDCYILKLDIKGYFMSINKGLLYKKVVDIIEKKYKKNDKHILIYLIKQIIYNDPTKNCIIKWKKTNWEGLPKDKSLFYTKENCWLPIWNLTSQVFSNIYLDEFDKYVKHTLKVRYYGRYVDDFYIIDKDKQRLLDYKKDIENYLKQNLQLTLHPKKVYLQDYRKWVLFLWAFIKPYRTFIRKRTIGNFYNKIQVLNQKIIENNWKADKTIKEEFKATINSYLWFLNHHKSYKIRQKLLLKNISPYFWNYFYISWGYSKVVKNG